jgi:hypothetical protein
MATVLVARVGLGLVATITPVDDSTRPSTALTPTERAWLSRSEALWRRARQLAAEHPEHDAADFYHVLRNLERTPTERLSLGLRRARLRPR